MLMVLAKSFALKNTSTAFMSIDWTIVTSLEKVSLPFLSSCDLW